jgi:hypothetical protein
VLVVDDDNLVGRRQIAFANRGDRLGQEIRAIKSRDKIADRWAPIHTDI